MTKKLNKIILSLFQKFSKDITKKLVKEVGFESKSNDDMLTKMNRNQIVEILCILDDVECIKKMEENFSSWLENPDTQ